MKKEPASFKILFSLSPRHTPLSPRGFFCLKKPKIRQSRYNGLQFFLRIVTIEVQQEGTADLILQTTERYRYLYG